MHIQFHTWKPTSIICWCDYARMIGGPPLFLFASMIISYLILKTITCQDSHHKYNSSVKLIVILYKVMLVCTIYLLICASHYSYGPFFNCVHALVLLMVWVNKKWTLTKNKSPSKHDDNPNTNIIKLYDNTWCQTDLGGMVLY
jgi:hypothetical protein